jgi:hypothetical protein
MHAECPLCGRRMKHAVWNSFFPAYTHEIKAQIRNLEEVIERLHIGEEHVELISYERDEMCPLCREITEGISSDAKKYSLIARLHMAILKLEEQRDQFLSGQI